jgi:hypothetical protein
LLRCLGSLLRSLLRHIYLGGFLNKS